MQLEVTFEQGGDSGPFFSFSAMSRVRANFSHGPEWPDTAFGFQINLTNPLRTVKLSESE